MESSQHEVTAPAFILRIFFWPHESCGVAQLQQRMENGPTVRYRIAWWLGHLLGFGVNAVQSLRAEISRSQLPSGGHRNTNRLARFSPERTGGK